jgi:hypothetical protein
MPAFMFTLRERNAIAVACALEFIVLTNVRTDPVLKATLDHIDLRQGGVDGPAGKP